MQPSSGAEPGALLITLLGARFLVELALFAAPVVIGLGSLGGWAGVVVGLVVAAGVATVWGLVLSPRRRYDVPLVGRVLLELALFAAAAVGLALVGRPGWAVVLAAVELVVLAGLAGFGLAPGSDVGTPSSDEDRSAGR